MSNLYSLPRRYGPRQSLRGKRPKACPVVRLEPPVSCYRALYSQASKLDETDIDGAMVLYTRALDLAELANDLQYQALILVNTGNLYYRKHDTTTARAHYMRALELSPTVPEASYNLGYLELEHGNVRLAVELLQRATTLDPVFADAWFNLGMAYERNGRAWDASNAFRRYVKLEPRGEWSERAKQHIQPASLSLVK